MALELADFVWNVSGYAVWHAAEIAVAGITIAGCVVAVAVICRTSRTRYIGE